MHPINLYFAFDDKDYDYIQPLEKQLRRAVRNEAIRIFHHREISAGSIRNEVIQLEIDKADAFILFISSDFLNSDFYFDWEKRIAGRAKANKKLPIIPILVRACMWDKEWFSIYHIIPDREKTLSQLSKPALDEEYTKLASFIEFLTNKLSGREAKASIGNKPRTNLESKDIPKDDFPLESFDLSEDAVADEDMIPVEISEASSKDLVPTPPIRKRKNMGKIVHDIPTKMQLKKRYKCQVRVGMDEAIVLLDKEVLNEDDIKMMDVKISEIMEAELRSEVSGAFKVEALTEKEQFVEDDDYTEWVFYVTPMKTGDHQLLLKVSIIKVINNKERKKEIVLENLVKVITGQTNNPQTMNEIPIEDDGEALTRRVGGFHKKKKKEKKQKAKRVNYLFIIGIDQYEDHRPLRTCVKECKQLIQLLTTKYEFEDDKIYELFNKKATEDNIYERLRYYIKNLTAYDNLVIYFAGHGHYDELYEEGYWVPVNARNMKTQDYLSTNKITSTLKHLKAHHVLVISDSCYSGSLFTRSTRRNVTPVIAALDKHKSRWGITSGRSDEEVVDNSPFAKSLLYRLENNDEHLRASKLGEYLLDDVKIAHGAKQTPISGKLSGVGDYGGQFIFYLKGETPDIIEEQPENENQEKETRSTKKEESKPMDIKPEPSTPTNLKEFKMAVKLAVGADDYEKTFQLLSTYLDSDSDKFDTYILFSSRYNAAKKELENDGGIWTDKTRINFSRLKNSILGFTKNLEESDLVFP